MFVAGSETESLFYSQEAMKEKGYCTSPLSMVIKQEVKRIRDRSRGQLSS